MKPSRKVATTPKRLAATPKFKTPLSKVKDPVEVFCRIRPPATVVEVLCIHKINNVTVQLVNPDDVKNGGKEIRGTHFTFSFVFDTESVQKEVFSKVALPLIDDFLHFKNGLLFAYGVTSSGKTFTITGSPENCGILPRTLDTVFNSIEGLQARKYTFKSDRANSFVIQPPEDAMLDMQSELQGTPQRTPRTKRREAVGHEWSQRNPIGLKVTSVDPTYRYSVFVTFIEIYNNYVYDLLEEESMDDIKRRASSKQVREDAKRNMYVAGVTEIEVRNADEAFHLFQRGQLRRKVGNTALNTNSSRSHSVFTVKLVCAPVNDKGLEVLLDQSLLNVTQLSLVDLAGSERCVRTGNTGSQLKEAGNINHSLMVLRQCLEALREKQQTGGNKFVPYRMTKLTHLFRSFFEEEGKVRVIVCAHPGESEYEELVHVMKFAEVAQDVMISRPMEPSLPLHGKPKKLFGAMDEELLLVPKIVLPAGMLKVDDSVTLITLVGDLRDRHAAWVNNMQTLDENVENLRETLVDVHDQNSAFSQQVLTLEMDLKARDHQLQALERKRSADKLEKEHLKQQVERMEFEQQKLHREHQEKDFLAKKYEVEKECIRNDMEERIETQRKNHKRIMESILAQKEAELQAKICLSKEKFQMLKDILNAGDNWDPKSIQFAGPQDVPSSASDARTKRLGVGDFRRCESRGPPTCNPRRARSQSADGGVWVEHAPPDSVDTGTIFQPHMKKKKSLSKLNAKDICKEKGNGYVLTHQEQDVTGDVETQLIKGSILPSSAGGVQVIFNDVETLRQSSPKKRSAENERTYGLRDRGDEHKPPLAPKKPRQ